MLDAACAGEIFTSPVPDQMLEATKTGRRRRRRAAHREELHRRRDELRDGRRAGRSRDRRRRRVGRHRRRRRRPGQHLHRRPPRRRRRRCCSRRSSEPRPSEGRSLAEVAERRPAGQRQRPQHGHGADVVHGPGGRSSRPSTCPRTRWRSASASTASRVGSGSRSHRPERDRRDAASSRSSPTSTSPAAPTGVIAVRQRHGRHPLLELYLMYDEVAAILEKAGVPVARSLVGPYITSLDMAGCSVTLLRPTTSCCACGTLRSTPRPAMGLLNERRPERRHRGRRPDGCATFARGRSPRTREYLTELDAAIGDADHGVNMDRGMTRRGRGARRGSARRPPGRCSRRSG